MSDTILLDHVSKRYGAFAAVDDVTLTVGQGESVALLGHNGAGKTTLMKLLLGLTRPSDGRLEVLGAPVGTEQKTGIGFLPESIVFHDAMTSRELLRFYARLKRAPLASVDDLLRTVGLADAARKRVKTYSKGMRQRLGLAQAMLGSPKLLLLDEPTSGLDPASRVRFYDSMQHMADEGATVLLSSHALTEVEARTDRVAIMKEGRLVACGSLSELRRRAALPVRIVLHAPPGGVPALINSLGQAAFTPVNDHAVELLCPVDKKMTLLREITNLGVDIEDIDIEPPTLDRLYAHFRDAEASA
jgi:Cu-processing system ATP-binding protein